MQEQTAVLELQAVADASSEDGRARDERGRFAKYVDTSIDTSIIESEEESEPEEIEAEPESAAAPSTAEVEVLDEKADSQTEVEYSAAVQERIDKLTERWRSTERLTTEQAQEIAQLREQLTAVKSDPEPFKTLKDFEYDDEGYQSYLATEIPKRAAEAARQELQGYQAKAETESREDAFRRREKEFAVTHPDYLQKVYGEVNGVRSWQASSAMAAEIISSDRGQELSYYLASNPETAAEIAALNPRETIRRMALLEDKLMAEKAKAKPKKVSDAPPPPPKIVSGDAGLTRGFYEGMSDKEFDKLRRKQIANR